MYYSIITANMHFVYVCITSNRIFRYKTAWCWQLRYFSDTPVACFLAMTGCNPYEVAGIMS